MSCVAKIAALCLFMTAASPMAMAEKPVTASVPVSYGDLNLSSPAGVQTLLQRIETASKKVCGARPTSVRYGQLEAHLNCRMTAMSDAVGRLNHPTVNLAWEGEAGRALRIALR